MGRKRLTGSVVALPPLPSQIRVVTPERQRIGPPRLVLRLRISRSWRLRRRAARATDAPIGASSRSPQKLRAAVLVEELTGERPAQRRALRRRALELVPHELLAVGR